ncbi:MAG: ABC transporter permease subunit [Actinomycetota bacterium]
MRLLLLAEARRALSRRLVWFLAAISVLAITIAGITTLAKSHREPGFASEVTRTEQEIRDCIEGRLPPQAGKFGEPGFDFGQMPAEDRQEFCRFSGVIQVRANPAFALEKLRNILRGTTVPFVILSWLLGASLIGAEWRAGTMTTLLTWESNRLKLFLAKALVAIALAMTFTVVMQILLSVALTPAAVFRGSTAGVDGAFWRAVAGVLMRGSLLAGVASAIGFSIGATGRNTAAALGIGFLYLAVIDGGFLGGNLEKFRRWLLTGNAIILVTGEPDEFTVPGRGVGGAAVLLSVYAAGAVAFATSIFRRRDVT